MGLASALSIQHHFLCSTQRCKRCLWVVSSASRWRKRLIVSALHRNAPHNRYHYRGNDHGNGKAFIKRCGNTAVMARNTTAPPRWRMSKSFFLYSSSNVLLPTLISILLSYHVDFPHSLPSRSSHLHTVNSRRKPPRSSPEIISITITNSRGLNTDPWCNPTFTLNALLSPSVVLTTVCAPSYIAMTAFTNHSSTPTIPHYNLSLRNNNYYSLLVLTESSVAFPSREFEKWNVVIFSKS